MKFFQLSIMSALWLAQGSMLACSAVSEPENLGKPEAREQAEDVAALVDLMRWDRGNLPSASSPLELREDSAPDAELLTDVIRSLEGGQGAQLRFEEEDGRLFVDTPERDISAAADQTDEDALEQATRDVLSALGADLQQADLLVSTLQAAGGAAGEEVTVRDVAKKVYVQREVLGLGIPGEYLVGTFSLNGEIVRMAGRWRRFDYEASQLYSDMDTHEEVFGLAAEQLASQQVAIRPSVHAIDVGTFYLAVPPDGNVGWTLRLCGIAALRDADGNGMGSEGLIPTYEFFLDGSGSIRVDQEAEPGATAGPVDDG